MRSCCFYFLFCMRISFITSTSAIINSALMSSDTISSFSESPSVSQMIDLTESNVIYSSAYNSTSFLVLNSSVAEVINTEYSSTKMSSLIPEDTLNYLVTSTEYINTLNYSTNFFSESTSVIESTVMQESSVKNRTENALPKTTFWEDVSLFTPISLLSTSIVLKSLIEISIPDSVFSTTYPSLLVGNSVTETSHLKSAVDSVLTNISSQNLIQSSSTLQISTSISTSIRIFTNDVITLTDSSALNSASTINANSSKILLSSMHLTELYSNSLSVKSFSYPLNSSISDKVQSTLLTVVDNSIVARTPTVMFSSKLFFFTSIPVFINSPMSNSPHTDIMHSLTSMSSKSVLFSASFLPQKSINMTKIQMDSYLVTSHILNTTARLTTSFNASHFSTVAESSFVSSKSIVSTYSKLANVTSFSAMIVPSISNFVYTAVVISSYVPCWATVVVNQTKSFSSYSGAYNTPTAFNDNRSISTVDVNITAESNYSMSEFSEDTTTVFPEISFSSIVTENKVMYSSAAPVSAIHINTNLDQATFSVINSDFSNTIQPTRSFSSSIDVNKVDSSNAYASPTSDTDSLNVTGLLLNSTHQVTVSAYQSFTTTLSMCLIYYSTLILKSLDISPTIDMSKTLINTALIFTSSDVVWLHTNGYSLHVTSSILDDISSKKITFIEESGTAINILSSIPKFSHLESTVYIFSDMYMTSPLTSLPSLSNNTMQLTSRSKSNEFSADSSNKSMFQSIYVTNSINVTNMINPVPTVSLSLNISERSVKLASSAGSILYPTPIFVSESVAIPPIISVLAASSFDIDLSLKVSETIKGLDSHITPTIALTTPLIEISESSTTLPLSCLLPSLSTKALSETMVCISFKVIETASFTSFVEPIIVETSASETARIFESFTLLPLVSVNTSLTATETSSEIMSLNVSKTPITDSFMFIQPTVSETLALLSSILPVTSTTRPQTSLPQDDAKVRITLNVSQTIDETSEEFRKDLEQKLVETFISLKSGNKRKRKLVTVDNVTAEIVSTKRLAQEVNVEFTIAVNNNYMKASDVVTMFNYLSQSGLERKLGYQVNSPVTVSVPTVVPHRLSDVVGVIVAESANNNLSIPLNQMYFEYNITAYYKQKFDNTSSLAAKIIYSKREDSAQIYLELFFILNGISLDASSTVSFFNTKNLSELSMALSIQVLEKPFIVNAAHQVNQTDKVKIVIKTPNNVDISKAAYMQELSLKLSLVYMKAQKNIRSRRATSSVVANIASINDLFNGNHQAIFVIIDKGVLKTASETVSIMNKISIAEMSVLLEMQVITPPEPLLSVIGAAVDDVKYWIIGAVIGPIIFVSLVCFGIIWKCKRGSAPRKVLPEKIGIEKKMGPAAENNVISSQVNETIFREKQSLAVPLFSANNKMQNEDDKSLRRKVTKKSVTVDRQNQVYNQKRDYNKENDEDDNDDNDDDEEEDEEEDEEIGKLPTVNIRKKVSTPVSKHPHLEYENFKEKSSVPLSPISRSSKMPVTAISSSRRPFEMTANVISNDEVLMPVVNSAANVPTFKQMTEMKSLTSAPPVRFRKTVDSSLDSFTNPTGPLPLLSMKTTSLMSAQQTMNASPESNLHLAQYQQSNHSSATTAMDSDLQHKMEIERQRNKQRQRNQFFKSPTSASVEAVFTPKDKGWKREQEKINDILEPGLTTRKGRKRRRMRRKYKVHILPNSDGQVLKQSSADANLKEFKKIPESSVQQTTINSFQSNPVEIDSSDTDISMREARQRIHSLLDDTFSAIKNYQKNLIKDESPLVKNNLTKEYSQRHQAGMHSGLPVLAPGSGRTAIPVRSTPDSKLLKNAYTVPYSPYMNTTQFVEPMLSWDPVERQRFVNQRLGYPVYGQVPASLTLPYGTPGQNIYITPVHQRPDGVGNMVWTPHMENHMDPMQPFNIMERDYLSRFPQAHSTILDMNDFGDVKSKSGSQPLIRAIKEELQRLSNSAQGRTKVQEFQTRPTIHESVT